MARVLLIEDEPVLRGSMARGLGKLPSLTVLEAGNLADALAIVDATPPDCIISDIDLPGRAGIEIVGELSRRGLSIPILFVSAYLKAYRSQIPRHPQVDVLEKPVPLEQLRRWTLEHLAAPAAARTPFCAADYLQLACMGRHSIEIRVDAGAAGRARITVLNGEVWSARDALGTGVAAFERWAFQREALVECRVLEGEPGPRDIERGWEVLLLDTARRIDERTRAGAAPVLPGPAGPARSGPATGPDPAPSPAAPAPSEAQRFGELWDEGILALLRKDHETALRVFVEARRLRPDDARVVANLKRLEDLGFRGPSGEEA